MSANLRINGDRLWSSIMETGRFGATPKGGIKRLTLTKEDAAVRHWFKEQTETLGCKVIVDEVGNMFAIRPGKRSGMIRSRWAVISIRNRLAENLMVFWAYWAASKRCGPLWNRASKPMRRLRW